MQHQEHTNLTEDTFQFFAPIESFAKAESTDKRRRIQGIASTDHRDLQGEVVNQKGIDTSYFLKYGYINDDHKDGPENKVGEPLDCKATPDGLWISAFLYKGKERAEYWWEHLKTLEENKSNRKVGFSIQGKVLKRDGNTIVKCWLQDIAITASPVNTHSYAEIMKSLNENPWCKNPGSATCKGTCCPKGLYNKTRLEEEEKALSVNGMGSLLIPQSLEGKPIIQTFKSESINYGEAVDFMVKSKGYSLPMARAFANAIFVNQLKR